MNYLKVTLRKGPEDPNAESVLKQQIDNVLKYEIEMRSLVNMFPLELKEATNDLLVLCHDLKDNNVNYFQHNEGLECREMIKKINDYCYCLRLSMPAIATRILYEFDLYNLELIKETIRLKAISKEN